MKNKNNEENGKLMDKQDQGGYGTSMEKIKAIQWDGTIYLAELGYFV